MTIKKTIYEKKGKSRKGRKPGAPMMPLPPGWLDVRGELPPDEHNVEILYLNGHAGYGFYSGVFDEWFALPDEHYHDDLLDPDYPIGRLAFKFMRLADDVVGWREIQKPEV